MNDTAPAHVVLYTEETFLAEGLACAFRTSAPDFRLAASCQGLADAIEFVRNHTADILLLDLDEEVTIASLHELRRANPRCRIVLWTSTISREMAFQAIEIGIRGILPKSTSIEKSLAALRSIREGDTWFEKETLQGFLFGRRVVLTRREGQLVTLLSQGLKNKEIAWTLQITEGTVKVYLSRLFKKLGVNDRFELALCGLKNLQSGYSSFAGHPAPGSNDRAEASLTALRTILVESHDDYAQSQRAAPSLEMAPSLRMRQ